MVARGFALLDFHSTVARYSGVNSALIRSTPNRDRRGRGLARAGPRPMRSRLLLTDVHSYVVGLNRRLAHEMARVGVGEWDVTALAPAYFRGAGSPAGRPESCARRAMPGRAAACLDRVDANYIITTPVTSCGDWCPIEIPAASRYYSTTWKIRVNSTYGHGRVQLFWYGESCAPCWPGGGMSFTAGRSRCRRQVDAANSPLGRGEVPELVEGVPTAVLLDGTGEPSEGGRVAAVRLDSVRDDEGPILLPGPEGRVIPPGFDVQAFPA